MAEWIIPALSLVIGLASGWIGAYIGMKVGLARVETQAIGTRESIAKIEQWQRDRERAHTEWLRDEYQRAIRDINERLYPLTTRMETVERDSSDARAWQESDGL
ncbi:MAG TPA: hypothetical protein VGL72_30525, partial [Bryobacteraceae bacterium]